MLIVQYWFVRKWMNMRGMQTIPTWLKYSHVMPTNLHVKYC